MLYYHQHKLFVTGYNCIRYTNYECCRYNLFLDIRYYSLETAMDRFRPAAKFNYSAPVSRHEHVAFLMRLAFPKTNT